MFYSDENYKLIPVPAEYADKYEEYKECLTVSSIDVIKDETGIVIERKINWLLNEEIYNNYILNKNNNQYKTDRAVKYPPQADYLDAKVKQVSPDAAIVAEGFKQEQDYYAACLQVKIDIPKPEGA